MVLLFFSKIKTEILLLRRDFMSQVRHNIVTKSSNLGNKDIEPPYVKIQLETVSKDDILSPTMQIVSDDFSTQDLMNMMILFCQNSAYEYLYKHQNEFLEFNNYKKIQEVSGRLSLCYKHPLLDQYVHISHEGNVSFKIFDTQILNYRDHPLNPSLGFSVYNLEISEQDCYSYFDGGRAEKDYPHKPVNEVCDMFYRIANMLREASRYQFEFSCRWKDLYKSI